MRRYCTAHMSVSNSTVSTPRIASSETEAITALSPSDASSCARVFTNVRIGKAANAVARSD
eukprot:2503484-Pleurochrysis_carterae.AAC.1